MRYLTSFFGMKSLKASVCFTLRAYLKRPVAHLAVATALDSTAPGPHLVL